MVGPSSCPQDHATAAIDVPPARPKRPLTPYNIFFQHERRKLLAAKANNQKGIGFAGMARTVAARWKMTPRIERQKFIDLAVADRARYDEDMAVWKYRLRQHDKAERKKSKRLADASRAQEEGNNEKDIEKRKKKIREEKQAAKAPKSQMSEAAPAKTTPNASPQTRASLSSSVDSLPLPQDRRAPQNEKIILPAHHPSSSCSASSSTLAEFLLPDDNKGAKHPTISDEDDDALSFVDDSENMDSAKDLSSMTEVRSTQQENETLDDAMIYSLKPKTERPVISPPHQQPCSHNEQHDSIWFDDLAEQLGEEGVDFIVNLFRQD